MKLKLLLPILVILFAWGCKSEDDPAPSDVPACKTCATYVKEWHDTLALNPPIEYILYPNTFCNHEWDTLEGRTSTQIVEVSGQWWKYEMTIHCQ